MPKYQQEMSLSKYAGDPTVMQLEYPGADATDEEKAEYTFQRYTSQDPLYLPFERQWTENIAFIRSRQWDRWDPLSLRMRPDTKSPPWRERLVDNYTWAIWKTMVAKLTKNRPAWDIRPASGDPQDINAALLGRAVLEWLWTSELKMSRSWRRAVSWVASTGNVWLEVDWDPLAGGTVPLAQEWPIISPNGGVEVVQVAIDPETGEPLVDAMGNPLLDPQTGLPFEPERRPRGQVRLSVHSPYAVRVNPEAFSDPEALTEAMVAHVVTRSWFERQYGKELADEITWGGDWALERVQTELESMSTGGARDAKEQLMTGTSDQVRGQTTLIIKHYHKPDADHPEGRFWIAASSGVLVEDEQPLPLGGTWPLVHIPAYDNPGLLLSAAPIEPIVPLNRRLNEQNSRIAEHEKIMMRGKWLVPKGAGLKKGAITSKPGEIIEHMPGFVPVQANIKALPAAVYNERETTKSDIQFVSGVHKISLGQPPPGVTAGKAFLVLQEADDTDLGPILASLSDGLSETGQIILWFVRNLYDEPRTIETSGMEAGEWLYRDFVGDQLDPHNIGSLGFQVKIQEGSMFPWSKAAAQEVALQVLSTPVGQALLMDDQGGLKRDQLRRLLQVGGLENLVDANDPDTAEAERIFNRIITGRGVPEAPMPWQNLAAHIAVFERHFKSATFEGEEPGAQQVAIEYYLLMKQILEQQMFEAQLQAAQQQIQLQGAATYAEESARHSAEVEIKGNPERESPGGSKTLAAREKRGERVSAKDVKKG